MAVTTPEPASASQQSELKTVMLAERHQQSDLIHSKPVQIVRMNLSGERHNWRTYRNDSF